MMNGCMAWSPPIGMSRTTTSATVSGTSWPARILKRTIKHPVGNQLPGFGAYFNIGPVEMSGSSTTIKQTSVVLGPSMRFIADLSNWDGSFNNIDIGQSGQILSGHYKDQWDAYYVGRSYPMQYEKVAAKE